MYKFRTLPPNVINEKKNAGEPSYADDVQNVPSSPACSHIMGGRGISVINRLETDLALKGKPVAYLSFPRSSCCRNYPPRKSGTAAEMSLLVTFSSYCLCFCWRHILRSKPRKESAGAADFPIGQHT